MKKKIQDILVDIDKTLTPKACWTPAECLTAEPNLKAIEKINKLGVKTGVNITFYTARPDSMMTNTFIWLRKYIKCPYRVSNYKIPGSLYIDNDSMKI